MKIAFFSTTDDDRQWFGAGQSHHELTFLDEPLTTHTALKAADHQVVCCFAHDNLTKPVLQMLHEQGIHLIALRCVGTDHVDLSAALELDITVLTPGVYSPYSVAEQAVGLLMALNRHIPLAHQRVKMGDFSLPGLLGQDLHGKTVGVVGTGHIGRAFLHIMQGFGCRMLAHDRKPNPAYVDSAVRFVPLGTLLAESDVVSLHCPLTPLTEEIISRHTLTVMKPTALLINTARGRLVDTMAVLDALDSGQLAGYGADVYANETEWFHRDFTAQPITDAVLNRLRLHPRVLLTPHQGYLTREALQQIAHSLFHQLSYYKNSQQQGITRTSLY